MKNLHVTFFNQRSNKRFLLSLPGLLFCLFASAQTELPCTEDWQTPNTLLELKKPGDSTINPRHGDLPPVNPPFQTYERCANADSNLRAVGYIHGLGGSIAAWDKQIRFTDSAYSTACFGVDYGSGSYEVSFFSVGQKVKNDLSDGFDNVDESHEILYNTTRCHNDDYVIAHSQGGIASRYLDWQWNTNPGGSFGSREFYGLVTFGTSHAGADIALTKDEHYAFVADVISTVILYKANEAVYDLTSSFLGTFIASGVYDLKDKLDTLIKNELAPLMLSSVHTPTLDEMSPGSPMMNTLNNHWGSMHRVAFFGIEDEPECWRVMGQVITKGSDEYPLWGAQPDKEFMSKMEEVRAIHSINIEINNKMINVKRSMRNASFWLAAPILNGQIVRLREENDHRRAKIEFLNNANTQWRYLIGSYHRDSFETKTETIYVVDYTTEIATGNPRFNREIKVKRTFNNQPDAQTFANIVNGQVSQKTTVKQVLRFYPSDGVVLARSQMAFPGVAEDDIDFMPHNNHFQERNSSETERVLKALYNGNQYDTYFKLAP